MSRMTLSDRIAIEAGIYAKLNLKEIARKIHRTPRCVSEEIRRNSTIIAGLYPPGKTCHYSCKCKRHGICGRKDCHYYCRSCKEFDCQSMCSAFTDKPCIRRSNPPYVCNICGNRRICQMERAYYIAQQADAMAKRRYAEARSKPQTDASELEALDALVSPLIQKGQPLTHIYAAHGDEIPVSQRTLYNYIDSGLLSVGNLDLRRKVGYRPRRKQKQESEAFLNQQFRADRTYQDFLAYMEKHPATAYVEMDTVKGCREQGKRWLTAALGLETFRTLFPVILTDNGSEFKHTREMEYTVDGQRRTRLFYCDPQASWQKPHLEKNHEYIRYVLPRGKSFSPYTQDDIVLLLNHINSTRRGKLDGRTPFELADSSAFQALKEALGLKLIPADEVNLTPRLLKRT